MILERILAFVLVMLLFFPLINKVVRLANRAWNEREFLEQERLVRSLVITPLMLFFVFIMFYIGVIMVLEIVEI